MTAYDPNNIFAKILRGEFPCHKVYEDEHVLAFLDIMPRVPGHTLVIPKAPARNILDIKPDDYAHVARGAHRIAAAAVKAFNADGITVQQFSEAAGGQVVFHLHMHVMPRHDGCRWGNGPAARSLRRDLQARSRAACWLAGGRPSI
jgi:histidine triad (HIT) family protein